MEQQSLHEQTIVDGKYRILSVRSASPDGFLYDAENLLIGKDILLKEYYPRNEAFREGECVRCLPEFESRFVLCKKRFLREARTIRDFQKLPGIAGVTDIFEANGTVFCVIEMSTGRSLYEEESAGKLPMSPEQAFRGMIPVLEALERIHDSGFIHRTISPKSVRVTESGGFQIFDFGVPRERSMNDTATRRLRTDELNGYTPPERFGGGMEQGPWSDLYSVSAVLYYCVTGKEPVNVYERMLGEHLAMPSEMGITIVPALEKILEKGMALDREKRYQSAREMLYDIRTVFPEEETKQQKKKKIIRILLAAVAIMLVVVGGIFLYLHSHPEILKFAGVETETVLIIAEEGASDEDWAIVRQRAEVLAGTGGCVWRRDGQTATAIFPSSIFREKGSRSMLRYYLTEPWKLVSSYNASDESEESIEIQALDVEIADGEMPGLDLFLAVYGGEKCSEFMAGKAQRSYLKVTVQRNTVAMLRSGMARLADYREEQDPEHEGVFANSIVMLRAGTDYAVRYSNGTSSSDDTELFWYGVSENYIPFSIESDSVIDLTGYMQSEPYMRLMAWNMTHDGPDAEFEVYAEERVVWDDPGESIYSGENQKGDSYPIQNPVYLTYLPSWNTDDPEKPKLGDWYRKFYGFKEMLDKLHTPYAIGVDADNDREIVVKISANSIPYFYAEEMDQGSNIGWSCGWSRIVNEYDDCTIESYTSEDGKAGITLKVENSIGEKKDLGDDLQSAKKRNGSGIIYLTFAGEPIAAGEIAGQDDVENGVLYFSEILLQGTRTEDPAELCSEINALSGHDYGSNAYNLLRIVNVNRAGIPVAEQTELFYGDFGHMSEEDCAYIEKIAEDYETEVAIRESTGFHVLEFSGNLSDAGFPENGLEEMEGILSHLLENEAIRRTNWYYISIRLFDESGEEISCTMRIDEDPGSSFGRLSVTGRFLGKSGETESAEKFQRAKEYLDSSEFFEQYGGSKGWTSS